MAATARTACICQTVIAFDDEDRMVTTGCTSDTTRTFAPGHDARLKGFLIRHGAAGHDIQRQEGGFAISTSAEAVADRFGFGHMVRAGIKRAADKAFARELRAIAKKVAPQPTTITAKVGRWVRTGELSADGASFTYAEKSGKQVTTTKFTRV